MPSYLVSRSTLFLLWLLALMLPAYAQPVVGEHVTAELIAENSSLVRGERNWLALRLDHLENWHTYWTNPGDAGKPTTIDWDLPPGVEVGDIVWPTPKRIELPADLVDFGYENEVFLLIPVSISDSYTAASATFYADVQWLECEEICIPGGAALTLDIPVTDGPVNPDLRWQQAFADSRISLPREDIETSSMFHITDGEINLLVQATDTIFGNAQNIRFIPGEHRIWDYNASQQITSQLSSMQLVQQSHTAVEPSSLQTLTGLLVVTDDAGKRVSYPITAEPEIAVPTGQSGEGLLQDSSLPLILAFALMGGMILNLMPCVFPVLSLKIMGLVNSSGQARSHQRLHGLVYTAGVILAFVLLAGILLMLRAGGESVLWGYHLQKPWVVALLVYLFTFLGLAMAGWVQIGARFMGLGSGLMEKQGLSGSFYTGVLASVVASPCTAPFMGAALAFALTQPALIALGIFATLGLGLALPFLLVALVPALASLLPKPGKWMNTFKHVMAVPLFLTAAWLLWVLSRQAELRAVLLVLGGSALLVLAIWIYSIRQRKLLSLVPAVLALLVLVMPAMRTAAVNPIDTDGRYEIYSAARLQELREQGTPVLVNMTASWCITCLVNERVALSSDSFYQVLEDNGVVYMKGDWTNNDPAITAVLKEYETSGVPLYLLFSADQSERAKVLPQLLTESFVVNAIETL